ncbi:hypothetical protein BDR22DRAFT_100790 [Usnea florida]
MDAFVLRPSLDPALPSSDDSTFRPPSSEQLLGQWFIVHSSLPFWRNKRNIKISYSAVSSPARPIVQTNDTVVYQTLNSDKLNTVNGVNTVAQSEEHGAWDWRGSGWVKVVNNHWEVLGHDCRAGDDARRWIVIHTGKSFFAPAAIHVYSRDKEELPEETRKTLVTALAQSQDLKGLAEDLFRVQQE